MIRNAFTVFVFAWAMAALAQTAEERQAPADSAQQKTTRGTSSDLRLLDAGKTTTADREERGATGDQGKRTEEELELEAIAIEAVIEKPNVDIIPKRVRPDFEEVSFIERSFERELKEIPKDLLQLEDDLDKAQKVDALKRAATVK